MGEERGFVQQQKHCVWRPVCWTSRIISGKMRPAAAGLDQWKIHMKIDYDLSIFVCCVAAFHFKFENVPWQSSQVCVHAFYCRTHTPMGGVYIARISAHTKTILSVPVVLREVLETITIMAQVMIESKWTDLTIDVSKHYTWNTLLGTLPLGATPFKDPKVLW